MQEISMSTIRNAFVASIAALGIGLGSTALSTPASAVTLPHGGGMGGAHGGFGGGAHGSFGGGGYRGGNWNGGGHYRNWNGGGNNWGWAPFAGGLAAGAIIGSGWPYYDGDYAYGDGYDYGYDNGCIQYRPVYNRYGRFIGRRAVNVCP
jgi:hypothetical protein